MLFEHLNFPPQRCVLHLLAPQSYNRLSKDSTVIHLHCVQRALSNSMSLKLSPFFGFSSSITSPHISARSGQSVRFGELNVHIVDLHHLSTSFLPTGSVDIVVVCSLCEPAWGVCSPPPPSPHGDQVGGEDGGKGADEDEARDDDACDGSSTHDSRFPWRFCCRRRRWLLFERRRRGKV